MSMTDQDRAAAFLAKWRSTMHHAYNDMDEAVKVWREYGINGLPRYTSEAEAQLIFELRKNRDFMKLVRSI